jgi:hypothetical protein
MLTRALVFTAFIRSPYCAPSAALSEGLKLGRGLRQLHASRVVYKKRKKLIDQNLVSRIMDESQQEAKKVPIVTIDGCEVIDSSDDDEIQFVAEVRPSEVDRAKRLNGTGILPNMTTRPE